MCCGRDRTQLRMTSRPAPKRAPPVNPPRPQMKVPFVYVGSTALVVTGPASGIQYRFDRPGARVEVDARDRILLASLSQLRQVR
jgi:hypothetical protein